VAFYGLRSKGHLSAKGPSLTVGLLTLELFQKDEDRCGSSHATVSKGGRFGRRAGGYQEEICELSFCDPGGYFLTDDCWGSVPARVNRYRLKIAAAPPAQVVALKSVRSPTVREANVRLKMPSLTLGLLTMEKTPARPND
jgi:hypothetical protein